MGVDIDENDLLAFPVWILRPLADSKNRFDGALLCPHRTKLSASCEVVGRHTGIEGSQLLSFLNKKVYYNKNI